MKNYWEKINENIVGKIRLRSRIAAEVNEDYIEAMVLQAAALEAMLRGLITLKVGKEKISHKKYWNGDAKFSELINYYELLDGENNIIKSLTKYNSIRNKIIHKPHNYTSINLLVKDAKNNYELGLKLAKKMLILLGYKIPEDFDEPLGFERKFVKKK